MINGTDAKTNPATTNPALTRRQTLAGAAAAGLVLAGRAAHAQTGNQAASQAGTAQGVVFEDADGSERRGASSRGIPGVMVSNGRDVVQTDADGRWTLPVAEGDSLFVIKPPGWATPADPATGLPRFAHVHAPAGTPAELGFRFPGLAASGPLPASLDFALRRQQEDPRFDAILFTDPQPESLAELGYVRDDVVAQCALAASGRARPSASPAAT